TAGTAGTAGAAGTAGSSGTAGAPGTGGSGGTADTGMQSRPGGGASTRQYVVSGGMLVAVDSGGHDLVTMGSTQRNLAAAWSGQGFLVTFTDSRIFDPGDLYVNLVQPSGVPAERSGHLFYAG